VAYWLLFYPSTVDSLASEKREGVTRNHKNRSGFRRVRKEQIHFPVVSARKNAGCSSRKTAWLRPPRYRTQRRHGSGKGPGDRMVAGVLTPGSPHICSGEKRRRPQHTERFPQKLRAIPANDAVETVAIQQCRTNWSHARLSRERCPFGSAPAKRVARLFKGLIEWPPERLSTPRTAWPRPGGRPQRENRRAATKFQQPAGLGKWGAETPAPNKARYSAAAVALFQPV